MVQVSSHPSPRSNRCAPGIGLESGGGRSESRQKDPTIEGNQIPCTRCKHAWPGGCAGKTLEGQLQNQEEGGRMRRGKLLQKMRTPAKPEWQEGNSDLIHRTWVGKDDVSEINVEKQNI